MTRKGGRVGQMAVSNSYEEERITLGLAISQVFWSLLTVQHLLRHSLFGC